MADQYIRYPNNSNSAIPTYASFAALPALANDGSAAITLDTDTLYIYNAGTTTWLPVATPGSVFSIGTIDSGSPSANGAHIAANALILQSASDTMPGLMNIGAQTFAGEKVFSDTVSTSQRFIGTLETGSIIADSNNDLRIQADNFPLLRIVNDGIRIQAALGDVDATNNNTSVKVDDIIKEIILTAQTVRLVSDAEVSGDLVVAGVASASNLSGTNTGDVTIGTANGLSLASQALSLQLASASQPGALSAADWTTFNGKQAAGNYLTALTGDGTASGPGSAALTLATVNSNVGSFTNASITVNAKGLVTAASSGPTPVSSLTGDVTGTASAGAIATTIGANKVANSQLAQMATLTLKGNNTGGTANAIDLTVAQVNTMLGTLSNPMTTLGDLIYGGASGTPTRLAGDTSNTRKFLRELSVASAATAPGWDTLVAGDIPNLPASIITSGQMALAVGGTNANLSATGGASQVLKQVSVGAAVTVGQLAFSDLSGTVSSGQVATATFTAPTVQTFTSTGTTTGWLFTISTSSTVAVNDTYTNNSNTYTVLNALSAQSGQVLFMSGASAPQASGTLTRSAGAGTASIAFTLATALATYTLPTSPRSPKYIRVRMVGGGGGGGSSGTTDGGASTAGTASAFGSNVLIAGGGTNGSRNSAGGAGGTPTINGLTGISISGGAGQGSSQMPSTASSSPIILGAQGGSSAFGGAGSGGAGSGTAGGAASANSGSGGGGAAVGQVNSAISGAGGGSGAYIDCLIGSPSSTYVYAVGGAGSGQSAGTSGAAGGNGAAGIIIVEEFYQ